MDHILNPDESQHQLNEIFRKMRESNTILFLGAGASVGEKKYLSAQLIELYEQFLGKELLEPNITTWIDILSADPNFKREHFDSFVLGLLQKLKVTEAHKIMATVPWNEIITTNYDLLVEQAYDEIANSSQKGYTLKPIRHQKQLNYKESNTEVKYIKLNGCMQDRSAYPFAFSTSDFNKLKSFYKNVLNELKNLSPEINFISIGYSYLDPFGKELLQKFDSYNFRDKKWMINIDPFPNESALPYYTQNRICIVKLSFAEFFQKYKEWETRQEDSIVKKRGLTIVDSNERYITMPSKLLLNLEGVVRQLSLNSVSRERNISEAEYYKGEEPNYAVISRGVDVIKTKYIEKFEAKIQEVFATNKSTLIPIFFINGDFGIGKSTMGLRLIHELSKRPDFELVSFEILDLNRVRKEFLVELIGNCKSKNLAFYCDEVEVESNFKSLLDIQRELSIEQIQGCNIFFIVPIRQNILEKFKLNRVIQKSFYLELSGKFEESEISELLDKLKNSGLLAYRDVSEKKALIKKVQREYDSDSFISLMSTITSGRHENDLIDTYNQLSKDAQKAFLYTALLHRHKLWMPAGILKDYIDMSWEDFVAKIVKAEGKGLLIQEEKSSRGASPDLFFRTKHPIIAQKLVDRFMPNPDKQLTFYDKLLRKISPGQSNSYLVNDLLKGFIRNSTYNEYQINKLFDAGYTTLSDDPYFLFNYAINLQKRQTITDLKKALDLLIYAESLLERRNHRFIHRRGVISFELAKLYYDHSSRDSYSDFYLGEAKDLFYTKQLMDPFSSYSYNDYIKLLIWEIQNLRLDDIDVIERQIKIEELFDLANRLVSDGVDRIGHLASLYADCLKKITDNQNYEEYLDKLHQDIRLRPVACILLYNHFFYHKNFHECDKLIDEIEYYQDNYEVIKFLFKYYGQQLYDPNIRIKLLRLSRENPHLEENNPLRFNFFNFVAESYNYQFGEGKRYLNNLSGKGYSIDPEYHEIWLDSDGNEILFEGIIVKNNWDKFKTVKVRAMQQNVKLMKGSYDKYLEGSKVQIRLHFYLYGMIAEIVEN